MTKARRGDPVRVHLDGPNTTPFSEQITAGRHSLIELKSVYGLSNLRDVQTTASGGTVAHSTSEFQLDTDTTTGSRAVLDSGERGRYTPGQACEAGIAVRAAGAAPTGAAEQRWGYFDDNNGYFFGRDATGLYVQRRSGGNDADKVRQADWSVDPLDGDGPSGVTLTVGDGNIFQIRFIWYGYGEIEWAVIAQISPHLRSAPIVVHRERVTGGTSVEQPNLPLRAELDNNGTGAAQQLFVAGRQFSVIGAGYMPNQRQTAEAVLQFSLTTTPTPVLSFRRKSAFAHASVKLAAVDQITTANMLWAVRTGMGLTGPSWGALTDVSATETSLELDTTASAASGGELIAMGLAGGGAGTRNSHHEELPRFDMVETQPITLTARTVTGTGTLDAVLSVVEEW